MLNANVLNINTEIVSQLIEKLQEFHAKEEVTFDEIMLNSEYEYDWSQILADHDDDLTLLEIKNAINELEPDQKIDLYTLFLLGREDFEKSEWDLARKEAKSNPNLQRLAEYLIAQPLASDYLRKGLEYLNISFDDAE